MTAAVKGVHPTRVVRAAALVLMFVGGCSSGASSADGGGREEDSGGPADDAEIAEREIVPAGCASTLVVPGDSNDCRADWRCSDGRSFSYVCGAADGGAQCFCITAAGVAPPLAGPNGCGQGEETLRARAPQACQWDLGDLPDGGGSD